MTEVFTRRQSRCIDGAKVVEESGELSVAILLGVQLLQICLSSMKYPHETWGSEKYEDHYQKSTRDSPTSGKGRPPNATLCLKQRTPLDRYDVRASTIILPPSTNEKCASYNHQVPFGTCMKRLSCAIMAGIVAPWPQDLAATFSPLRE